MPDEAHVEVCLGLACSEAFSADVLKDWERQLGLKAGQQSPDGKLSLRVQHCFGRCAVGPNIRVNGIDHSGQTPGKPLRY
jgi:NADH-quinone oxidoreductase subunit E